MTKTIDISKLDKNFAPVAVDKDLNWYDIRNFGVEGRGWTDTANFYDRLPARAKNLVREPVWTLSEHASGMCVRFITDAPNISARWNLRNANLSMPHFPSSGMSGVDLYAKINNQWIWAGTGVPQGVSTSTLIVRNLLPGKREYLLYMPLYNGVESAAIGIAPTASLSKAPARKGIRSKGFAVYGTSITQGGCASRAGMGYPEILSRALDCHSVNLGFSGNGPMEFEVIQLLAELDPAAFILDCLPNMTDDMVLERTLRAVPALRKARPKTPIILVENVRYQQAPVQIPGMAGHEKKNIFLKQAWKKLQADRIPGLFYVPGSKLLGNDNFATVDGVHPTDMGFARIAKALEPTVRRAMGL